MAQKNEVNTCLISRSHGWPDGVAVIQAKGRKLTYGQWYAEGIAKKAYFFRNDIALVNVSYADGTWDQHVVYPTISGEPDWGNAKKYLTPEEMDECRAENKRMLEIAATSEVYQKAMML